MAADQLQRVDGWSEPAGRSAHSTAVVDNQLYLWGGYQDGMPKVHNSAEKRQFSSSVEVFDVNTGCWEQRTTRGTPPLGVVGYSCVTVRNELHYFGGWCGHSSCYYNSVHTLSTSTLQWRMLAPSTTEGRAPMKKRYCGMVHFTDGEEDLLYVVGGSGPAAPSSPPRGAQYLPVYSGDVRTNEQHIFSLSTNGWSSPAVTGQAPPPGDSFTLTTVGEKRAAMFGGTTQSSYSDDLYIVDLLRHSVDWSKINKPVIKSVQWPEGRCAHAASHITGTVFVMIGGAGSSRYYDWPTLSDVWLCDTNQWNELPTLPHSVTKRYHHSVSVFHLGAHCAWVLVFGGWHYKAATIIIELIQDTSGQWCVGREMERKTLSNNTEYQERLREGRIKGLLGDRANTMMKELMMVLDQESRQLQQQLQESEQSSQRRIREVEEENKVLNDRLHQVQDQLVKNDKEIELDVQQVKQTDGLWQYLLLLSSFLFSRTAAASVLALLVAVSIAVGPSRDLSPTATPPTPPSSSGSTQLHPVTSDKALLNEFPIVHITEPLTLCRCLTNVPYADCRQLVGDYHMKTKTATTEILDMWFNQSPQLTWEDVVDTLFCYGLVNTAVPLANRHGVDWKPLHDKRKN